MPNFKSISFKMAVLEGAGSVCVIQKIPFGIGLNYLAFEIKTKMVDQLLWRQQIIDS